MQFSTRDLNQQSIKDREYLTPPSPEVYRRTSSGIVTLCLTVVAGVMFASLFFTGINVALTVLTTAAFYGAILAVVLIIDSGYLNKREEEVTKRQFHRLQLDRELASHRWEVINAPQPLHIQATEPLPLPTSNYVPAIPLADSRLKLAAVEFVTSLFTDEGAPNPRRILPSTSKRPGQVQRTKPKAEILDYLLALQMVWVEADGMVFFDVDCYPTLHEAIQALKRGTPAGREGLPPMPLPLAERGRVAQSGYASDARALTTSTQVAYQ